MPGSSAGSPAFCVISACGADGPPPVAQPIWIQRSEVLRASNTGIFHAAVERGHTVAQGTIVGRITDFHGKVVEEIRAPFGGEILYVIGTPPISKGEPVAMVGAIGAAHSDDRLPPRTDREEAARPKASAKR